MNHRLPLFAHPYPESPFARGMRGTITAHQFLADVCGLAATLPAGNHVLNLCGNRYRFTVGFAAGLLAGKTSLLPPDSTPETLRRLVGIAPDVFCLSDHPRETKPLPQFHFPATHFPLENCDYAVPRISADQTVAHLYTSGSTGLPAPHRKTWGQLVRGVSSIAAQLRVADEPISVVGTVPSQHMYGLEFSILLPLLTGGSFWTGRPFYPADIVEALNTVPRPRALISTPIHLRTLIDAEIPLPETDLLLSATSPLSISLARRAERALSGPLKEIYGCTETGQIATRRPAISPEWQISAGIVLEQDARDRTTTYASGTHIAGRIMLSDFLELTADRQFILHGRHADLINIAGKRTSLAYLNHQLTAIPGVLDGTFFVPDDTTVDGVTRLCACVVAPDLDRPAIESSLRQRIDPVFLPRPLHLVDSLPRNATGKLPRPTLSSFIADLDGRRERT